MVRELLTRSILLIEPDQATRIGCFVRAIQNRKTQILEGSSTYPDPPSQILGGRTPPQTPPGSTPMWQTMACFSASGNTPSVRDALHINVIVSANSGKACLTSHVGAGSREHVLGWRTADELHYLSCRE